MSVGELGVTTLRLPSADLGPASPLPSFVSLQRLPDLALSSDLPADMRQRIAYGRLGSPLPYALLSGYTRELRTEDVPAIRLASEHLEAYVLPGLGGRIWSLRDRVSGRDLVFANPRLQFANLALTDAWFAGGIEWNLGSTGHAATTCRPVFTGRVDTERGVVLRLWEWERTRDLVFSVDLMAPPGRPRLLAFVRVRNLDPETKPLYWWTNVAVPERPGGRVLAPADRAWRTSYDGSLTSVSLPHPDSGDVDASYPLTATSAADYFFEIPATQRHWVAAVAGDGTGMVQTATAALHGRKFFLWGTGPGGRRWQEWLCGPEQRYLEIQAGLATTQVEHLRLGGHGDLSWAEAYLPLTVDDGVAHGDWTGAVPAVEKCLDEAMSAAELDRWHDWWRAEVADRAPAEQLTAGSGAGLAELTIRGEAADHLAATPFGAPQVDEFRHLVELARTGTVEEDLAGRELLIPPMSARWAPVFEQVADGWWGPLMIAVRAQAAGDLATAERWYRDSAAVRPTSWSLRGLALLAAGAGDDERAGALYRDAVRRAPDCLALLLEATEQLLAAGDPAGCLELIDRAPRTLSERGRVVLQRCRGLLALGRLEDVRQTLADGLEVADLREGETLGELWGEAFGEQPLPARYDFRMHPD